MTKILVEICMISARELLNSSSFWKLQWFVVGWTDLNNKYCSKIDSSSVGSSNPNPTWKTKFSFYVDDGEDDLQRLGLTVEVHSREPVFLREKIHGIAYIPLKEFLLKYYSNYPNGFEELGSFQLQGKNSGKPRGFVDISVRIIENKLMEDRATAFNSGRSGKTLDIEDGQALEYPIAALPPSSTMPSYSSHDHHPQRSRPLKRGILRTRPRRGSSSSTPSYHHQHQDHPTSYLNINDDHQPNYPYDYQNSPESTIELHEHHRQRTPSPPPPPSNTGFIPTFFPETGQMPSGNYADSPPRRVPIRHSTSGNAGFGTGIGAGALAAGAVIFGDDFMSN